MKTFWIAAPFAAVVAALTALIPPTAAVVAWSGDQATTKPVKPVNLGCNTKADEDDPFISSSGYYLYYASNADKKFDLLTSKRRGGKWAAGKPVGGYVQTPADDRGAFLTPDGIYPQYLYYATKLDAKGDNFDLYVTYRNGARQDFVPPEAVNVVDTPADEQDPWLTRDGKTLYFSRKTKDGYRVFTATRTSSRGAQGFADPVLVEELPAGFHHATLTPNGKTMYLQGPVVARSQTGHIGRWGLFVSTKTAKTWGEPVPLDALNDASGPIGDKSPCLSHDGATLYFASDRDGGKGGLDLYSVPVAELKKK